MGRLPGALALSAVVNLAEHAQLQEVHSTKSPGDFSSSVCPRVERSHPPNIARCKWGSLYTLRWGSREQCVPGRSGTAREDFCRDFWGVGS